MSRNPYPSTGVMHDDRVSIYSEKPLVNSGDIRVLDIESAQEFNAPVHCSLRVVSLEQYKKQYQTLSYAWGPFDNSKTIFCDGKVLKVSTHLDLALRRIREKLVPKDIFLPTIWIDVICINQVDNLEKGKQVGMMGSIYQGSKRLIVWLGETCEVNTSQLCAALKNPRSKQSAQIFRVVTNLPWFRRRWIIQEVLKSPKGSRYVLLANFRCPLDTLLIFNRAAGMDGGDIPLTRMSKYDELDFSASYPGSETEEPPPLLIHMVKFRGAKTLNVHDRIYALLSISRDGETISIDYNADPDHMYLAVAKQYLGSLNSIISVLMCACLFRHEEKGSLPSWVPDWGISDELLRSKFDEIEQLRVHMCYLWSPNPPDIQQGGARDHLELSGTIDERDHLTLSCLTLKGGAVRSQHPTPSCILCIKRFSLLAGWRRPSLMTTWLSNNRSLTAASRGTAFVICVNHRVLILFTAVGASETIPNVTVKSYLTLPDGNFVCNNHLEWRKFCIH